MDNIEIFLRKAVKDGVFPGCCAVTIHKDISRFYCTGNLQIQPSIISNTMETMYDMASLTKVIVTTTLTLQMMEKHLFTLDTPVRKILPQFSHGHVKIAHLLTHTSGLPADHPDKRNICKEQLEKDIFHMDLLFEPGTQVLYSDLGFILLKDILETVTDTPLESLAKKQIFALYICLIPVLTLYTKNSVHQPPVMKQHIVIFRELYMIQNAEKWVASAGMQDCFQQLQICLIF